MMFLILCTCRFERKKNISLAIKAFALLPTSMLPACRLVVAGGYDTKVSCKMLHFFIA